MSIAEEDVYRAFLRVFVRRPWWKNVWGKKDVKKLRGRM